MYTYVNILYSVTKELNWIELNWICCEGIPRHVNYLIDEAVATGKGANATISYVHDFFNFHGPGETDAQITVGHQRTGRGELGGAAVPPVGKNIVLFGQNWCTVRAKTVKNILLFNILIYLFSSRISPNLLTDLCTTSRDGCYYSELEHWVLPRDSEW